MLLRKKKSLSDWIDVGEGMKIKIDYPTREQEQELQTILFSDDYSGNDKLLKWSQQYVRFTVKDWQGVDEKCILKDGILEENLWWDLVCKEENALTLATRIKAELEFTETDKKK